MGRNDCQERSLCLHDLLVYCSPTTGFSLEGYDMIHQVNIQLEWRGSPSLWFICDLYLYPCYYLVYSVEELHHYFLLLYKYRWETVLLIHLNKVSSRRNSTQSTLPHLTAKSDFCKEIWLNWCGILLFFWKCAEIEVGGGGRGEEKQDRWSIRTGELFPVFELKFS